MFRDINEPGPIVDTWRVWAKSLRLKLSRKKNQIGGGRTDFPAGEKTLERERERAQTSLYEGEIGWLEFVGLRTKVHLLDEGYA